MYNKKFCLNCKSYGHNIKYCTKPIESCGIILLYLSDDIKKCFLNKINLVKEEINNYNYKRIANLKNIDKYKNKIKFLFVEKNFSLNYIEFIRGLYDVKDNSKLFKMFSLMSSNEIELIKSRDFNFLWNKLWKRTAKKKIYHKEFLDSYNKFSFLLSSGKLNELLLIKSEYNSPEWEIPKGKRKINENNLECAMREIKEETKLNNTDYNVLTNLVNNTIKNEYYGTNDIKYKNIFFIGILNNFYETKLNINKEIKQCKLINIDEIKEYIRYYDTTKIQLLYEIFLFIMNICEDNFNEDIYLNA